MTKVTRITLNLVAWIWTSWARLDFENRQLFFFFLKARSQIYKHAMWSNANGGQTFGSADLKARRANIPSSVPSFPSSAMEQRTPHVFSVLPHVTNLGCLFQSPQLQKQTGIHGRAFKNPDAQVTPTPMKSQRLRLEPRPHLSR